MERLVEFLIDDGKQPRHIAVNANKVIGIEERWNGSCYIYLDNDDPKVNTFVVDESYECVRKKVLGEDEKNGLGG